MIVRLSNGPHHPQEEELAGITEVGRERVHRETRCRPPRLATECLPRGRLPEIRLANPDEAAKAEDTVMVWSIVHRKGELSFFSFPFCIPRWLPKFEGSPPPLSAHPLQPNERC